VWLEQVQEDMGLTLGDTDFFKLLHEKTALPISQINKAYIVNGVRKRLQARMHPTENVSAFVVLYI